jgi:hypothetical protein
MPSLARENLHQKNFRSKLELTRAADAPDDGNFPRKNLLRLMYIHHI